MVSVKHFCSIWLVLRQVGEDLTSLGSAFECYGVGETFLFQMAGCQTSQWRSDISRQCLWVLWCRWNISVPYGRSSDKSVKIWHLLAVPLSVTVSVKHFCSIWQVLRQVGEDLTSVGSAFECYGVGETFLFHMAGPQTSPWRSGMLARGSACTLSTNTWTRSVPSVSLFLSRRQWLRKLRSPQQYLFLL